MVLKITSVQLQEEIASRFTHSLRKMYFVSTMSQIPFSCSDKPHRRELTLYADNLYTDPALFLAPGIMRKVGVRTKINQIM